MLGDVQISLTPVFAVPPFSEAFDYGTDSGLYQYANLEASQCNGAKAHIPDRMPDTDPVVQTFKKWVR